MERYSQQHFAMPEDGGRRRLPASAFVAVLAVAAIVLSSAALLRVGSSPGAGSGSASGSASGGGGGGGTPDHSGVQLLAATSSSHTTGATITVTGQSSVTGIPDRVHLSIGAHTTGATAAEALATNNTDVTRLESSLLASGAKKADMQTSNLNIYANYNKYGDVTGFSVDDDLTVTLDNVAHAGAAIDDAANAVGNGITFNGVSLTLSNSASLLARARTKAVVAARTDASQIAAGAGVKLGPVMKITDNVSSGIQPLEFSAGVAANRAASVPLEAGSQKVSAGVTVVYAIG